MTTRTAVATAATVACLGLAAATPAGADPQNGSVFDVDCDTLGTLTNVAFSNGAASPGLVVDSNQVLLVYAWTFHVVFTPTSGDPRTRDFSYSRAAPRNGRLDHCTYGYTRTFPDGTAVVSGEIWLSYTPD